MSSSLPTWTFGVFLTAFAFAIGSLALLSTLNRKHRALLFVVFHIASLLFVLVFIAFGWRQAESQFIEIGQYYPLDSKAPVSIGDASQQPSYILDRECRSGPCFQGRIDFALERKPDSPNILTWELNGTNGRIRVKKPVDGFFKKLLEGVVSTRWFEDGKAGVSLSGDYNRFLLVWEPPSGATTRNPLTVPIVLDLDPKDASPRIVIEHPSLRVEELPSPRNLTTASNAPDGSQVVYLTSNHLVALRSTSGEGYMPTLTISSADPAAVVNAYLERPTSKEAEEGDDFIINNGLYRTGNPFGQRVYIGTERGIVATVVSGGGARRGQYIAVVVLLWLLPAVFFYPIASNGALFALVPAVQMLIGVRFILALRAYLWSPYSHESIEGAVLAALLVPLLLFAGCFAAGLQGIGRLREQQGWKKSMWSYLPKNFPPLVYYLVAALTLPALYLLLQPERAEFATTYLPAFQSRGEFLKSWAILLGFPPIIWGIGLVIDRKLRKSANRDFTYMDGADDPITYSITRGELQNARERTWPRRHIWKVAVLLGVAALAGGAWYLARGRSGWQLEAVRVVTGLLTILLSALLFRFSRLIRANNLTCGVAVGCLAWVISLAGFLVTVKAVWNLGATKLGAGGAVPESLFPYVPLRTNLAFELLIAILTIRLLAAFFSKWRRTDASFGLQGFMEIVVVFAIPPLMFFASFIASQDAGALLVHWPALIGATLIVTGFWPIWKSATGRRDAMWALLVAGAVVFFVGWLIYGLFATKMITAMGSHSTLTHRVILREGPEAVSSAVDTGGLRLIEAMEQNWRMMNYAAEGGFTGRGFGKAPVRGTRTFGDITLSDLVFSVYVMAEYGALGAIGLISLYLAIFVIVMRMAWDGLRDEPLRLALATAAVLMVVFPAIYMAAANLNQALFTGQDLPLLGLRSRSDIIRVGIALMLLAATLRPISASMLKEHISATPPRWLQLISNSLRLFVDVILGGREKKGQRLSHISDRWDAAAAAAINIVLVGCLVLIAAVFPLAGIARVSGNEVYKSPFDLAALKDRAVKLISDGHIWFEPVSQGAKPGSSSKGGAAKNQSAPPGVDPTSAYQLCIDDDIRGAAEDDTFYALVNRWNKGPGRDKHRGDGERADKKFDERQFFRLDTTLISKSNASQGQSTAAQEEALSVNPYTYRWTSPFRPPGGWAGALTEADSLTSSGGVLVGAGTVLPLLTPQSNDPVFFGVESAPVTLDKPKIHLSRRSFAVYETAESEKKKTPIFEIGTISGTDGALLRPATGDFDLFINGCPLVIGSGENCVEAADNPAPSDARSAPAIRLDYGDVIAYAPRDKSNPNRRTARYVFTYGRAQLGVFSYTAWINGEVRRIYPQREAFPTAQQIVRSLATSASGHEQDSIALTVSAGLNRDVYNLVRKWRANLDRRFPIRKEGSKRRMAVTLMDSHTGALLALASDNGTPYDPNIEDPQESDHERNLNFIRHRIGSAIKPFTASATLKAFPLLHELTIVDNRGDKGRVFGLPLGGSKGIVAHATEMRWKQFLPKSDNLYAVTLGLLGLCRSDNTNGLPGFSGAPSPASPLRLILTDGGTSLGTPIWASSNMFDINRSLCANLDLTPLRGNLDMLFDVRAGSPQYSSYDNSIWSPLQRRGLLSTDGLKNLNGASPEIPNIALADVRNFDDLRAVLLGGEIGDLPEYGNVGSAWSNVYLAQSMARITTGRKITAQIVAEASRLGGGKEAEEWFPGSLKSPWRRALLVGLEGVAREPGATARVALLRNITEINNRRGVADLDQCVVGSGRTYFTIFCKTGTIDPDETAQYDGPLHADSIFVFTAGIWDDEKGVFIRPVTGAIYIEQGTIGQAQALANELIKLLDEYERFDWSETKRAQSNKNAGQ